MEISNSESGMSVALQGGTLLDGTGKAPLPDSVVLINGQKIVAVGRKGEIENPKARKVIDVTGKFILPGLIDLHVHYFDWMGELFLAHGITTVKDVGNDIDWISTISAEIEKGKVRAPRIFYAGNGLDEPPPAWGSHVAVSSPEMAKRAVELLFSKGVSAIKVREKITPHLLAVIVEEAHRLSLPVTGHVRRTDAREAALAGIDGLEHLSGVVQALANCPKEKAAGEGERQSVISELKAYRLIQPSQAEELIKLLVKRNVALVPTLSTWWRFATDRCHHFAREDAKYAENEALAYVPQEVRKQWASSAFYELGNVEELQQIRSGYQNVQNLITNHYRAGGEVLAGSDTFIWVPGLSLHRELALLGDAGLTPLEIISIATRDNAEFLGKGAEIGTITPGKLADILVVSADPLEDISNTQQVALVIKGGQIVDTNYHADYSVPIPRPLGKRPGWLEKKMNSA